MTRKEAIDIISKATVYNDEERKALSYSFPNCTKMSGLGKRSLKSSRNILNAAMSGKAFPSEEFWIGLTMLNLKKTLQSIFPVPAPLTTPLRLVCLDIYRTPLTARLMKRLLKIPKNTKSNFFLLRRKFLGINFLQIGR